MALVDSLYFQQPFILSKSHKDYVLQILYTWYYLIYVFHYIHN